VNWFLVLNLILQNFSQINPLKAIVDKIKW